MKKLGIICLILFLAKSAPAGTSGEVTVEFAGKPRSVTYSLYLPESLKKGERLPLVVCAGGVPMKDDKYVRSSTDDCHSEAWTRFAAKHRFAILGLGFLFEEELWEKKQTYQFPRAWSGRAVDEILERVSAGHPVDKTRLFLYGVSGGAQFANRYAFYRPDWVKAVAAHAAGSYDPPLAAIGTRFLLTVGELDNDPVLRREMAEEFARALALFGIRHERVIVEGIAHIQTGKQDDMSRAFFAGAAREAPEAGAPAEKEKGLLSLPMGMPAEEVFKHFPRKTARTHRGSAEELFLTYLYGPQKKDFLTLHIKNGVLSNWGLNARHEVVDEYLTEFLSGGILRGYPKTFEAIRRALNKLPQEPFMKVVDRDRPVIFLDVTTGGIARYANAVDFYFREDDPPAFSRGFYLIKLGRDLEEAESADEIEGIIFHELTHHVLDHLRGPVDCDTEKEANRLVKEWGFGEELKKASARFGAKAPEDSPCYGK